MTNQAAGSLRRSRALVDASTRAATSRGERGEGVISAAIAVLIMAVIGALMWVGFKAIWEDTEDNTKDKVSEIGE